MRISRLGCRRNRRPRRGIGASRAFSVDGYGFDTVAEVVYQPAAIGAWRVCSLIKAITAAKSADEHNLWIWYWLMPSWAPETFWCWVHDRPAIADQGYGSARCIWAINGNEHMGHQFSRFALPIVWDIAEILCPLSTASGGLSGERTMIGSQGL